MRGLVFLLPGALAAAGKTQEVLADGEAPAAAHMRVDSAEAVVDAQGQIAAPESLVQKRVNPAKKGDCDKKALPDCDEEGDDEEGEEVNEAAKAQHDAMVQEAEAQKEENEEQDRKDVENIMKDETLEEAEKEGEEEMEDGEQQGEHFGELVHDSEAVTKENADEADERDEEDLDCKEEEEEAMAEPCPEKMKPVGCADATHRKHGNSGVSKTIPNPDDEMD